MNTQAGGVPKALVPVDVRKGVCKTGRSVFLSACEYMAAEGCKSMVINRFRAFENDFQGGVSKFIL